MKVPDKPAPQRDNAPINQHKRMAMGETVAPKPGSGKRS